MAQMYMKPSHTVSTLQFTQHYFIEASMKSQTPASKPALKFLNIFLDTQ